MSTIDRTRPAILPPLAEGQKIDRAAFHARYEAMPPGSRAELIGGVVHMPSPLSNDHGEANWPVVVWVDHYLESTPGPRVVINASVFLDDAGEPQPDVAVRIPRECGGRTDIKDGYIVGPPELVIEIARSSRAVDLGPKYRDYERAGVSEYVVVGIDPASVSWFVLCGGRFEPRPPGDDGLYRSQAFPGLWLDHAALFAGDRARLRAAVDAGMTTPEHAAFVDRMADAGVRHDDGA